MKTNNNTLSVVFKHINDKLEGAERCCTTERRSFTKITGMNDVRAYICNSCHKVYLILGDDVIYHELSVLEDIINKIKLRITL